MRDEPLISGPVPGDDEDEEAWRSVMDGLPLIWLPRVRADDDPKIVLRALQIAQAQGLAPERAVPIARLELLREKRGQPATTATEPPSAELLTVKETAAVLRAQPNYVYELLARGELPAVQVGRKKLVRRGDLDAFIRRGGTTPDGDD